MWAHLEDRELIAFVQQGERGAFDELWRRYRDPLHRVMRRIALDERELEDVLQETAIRVWVALSHDQYSDQHHFLAWLRKIALNCLRDECRRSKQCISLDDESAPELVSPGPSLESIAIVRQLCGFLDTQLEECLRPPGMQKTGLTEGHVRKLAFLWYYVDGHSLDEVTAMVGDEFASRGWRPPTTDTLNNWLGGGRLVRQLIEHLVESHSDTLDRLGSSALEQAGLSPDERTAWVGTHRRSATAGQAEELNTMSARLRKSAARKIARVLTVSIRADIHKARLG